MGRYILYQGRAITMVIEVNYTIVEQYHGISGSIFVPW